MSRSLQVFAYTIGAKWFIPISFIAAMISAVPLFSRLDERHIEKGDRPHSLFFMVWRPGEAGAPFGFSKLDDRSRIKASASFIMDQPSGRIEGGKSTVVAYKVLWSGASEQHIEVAYADDTYSSWSRYRATHSAITPLFSKVMEPGHLFMAFPVALGFAAAIYAVGARLRRRVARDDQRASRRTDG